MYGATYSNWPLLPIHTTIVTVCARFTPILIQQKIHTVFHKHIDLHSTHIPWYHCVYVCKQHTVQILHTMRQCETVQHRCGIIQANEIHRSIFPMHTMWVLVYTYVYGGLSHSPASMMKPSVCVRTLLLCIGVVQPRFLSPIRCAASYSNVAYVYTLSAYIVNVSVCGVCGPKC